MTFDCGTCGGIGTVAETRHGPVASVWNCSHCGQQFVWVNPDERKGTTVVNAIKAFCLGMIEFRSTVTTHFDGDLIETYDRGRDLAHRLTFRRFEPF